MNWTVRPFADLGDDILAMWRELLIDAPLFESPYFRPEYCAIASSVFPNIEVAYSISNGCLNAIFPFERINDSDAVGVGRDLNDYEGIIYRPGVDVDTLEMLKAANLARWRFDHVFPVQSAIKDHCWAEWESPQIRLNDGPETYLKDLYSARKKIGPNFRRARKKLSKDSGELRFEPLEADESLLDLCLEWKSQQYEASDRDHPFREPWARQLLWAAMKSEFAEFRGSLSVVYAGEQPIAMEYAFQSECVSHMLVCTYDVGYQSFSPGFVRDLGLIDSGCRDSFRLIDMGKGVEQYKHRVMNDIAIVGEGCVDRNVVRRTFHHGFHNLRIRVVKSPKAERLKVFVRRVAARFPILRRLLIIR